MFPLFATSVVDIGSNLPPVPTTLAKLVEKFAADVVDTGRKFAAGVVETGGIFVCRRFCPALDGSTDEKTA